MGKGKKIAEEWGWETQALAEEGLFWQAEEFEFYPEGHSGPWGFVGKLKGPLTACFHSTPSKGKEGQQHTHPSPQNKGTDLSLGEIRREQVSVAMAVML